MSTRTTVEAGSATITTVTPKVTVLVDGDDTPIPVVACWITAPVVEQRVVLLWMGDAPVVAGPWNA